MNLLGKSALVAATAAASCVAYGALIEVRAFQLRRVQVPVLPSGQSPIRILQLSDLHLLPKQLTKKAWLRTLADTAPDFIINTGDNLASTEALPSLQQALSPLAGIPGVFVLGSNDRYAPQAVNPLKYLAERRSHQAAPLLPTNELVELLTGLGWSNAEEQRLDFQINGSRIHVRGCGDAHIDLDDYQSVMGAIPADSDLMVAVTHAPYRRVLDAMVDDGADLIVAGHTHGGQVCLPGGHALTTNCDLPLAQARGLSRHRHGPQSAYLNVCAGLGTSPYAPYRFCCPPEATLLTLVPRED